MLGVNIFSADLVYMAEFVQAFWVLYWFSIAAIAMLKYTQYWRPDLWFE